MQNLKLVVPCYNEENRLNLAEFKRLKEENISVLFVNDGSKDRTQALLEEFCAEDKTRGSVLALDQNRGKAEAVRRGIMQAIDEGAKFVGYADADLAVPVSELVRLAHIIRHHDEMEVLMGSRVRLLGKDIQRSAKRHYLGRIFATFASWVLRLSVYDTQCGVKYFRVTSSLQDVFSRPFQSRWIFDVEILSRLTRLHEISERGVFEEPLLQWHEIKGSKLRPRHFVLAAFDLVRIYLREVFSTGSDRKSVKNRNKVKDMNASL